MTLRKAPVVLLLMWSAALCRGQTLQEVLISLHIPISLFNPAELLEAVQSSVARDPQRVTLAYQKMSGELLSGQPELVEYSKSDGEVRRSHDSGNSNDECSGSILGVQYVGDFTFVATHINPSAGCILVFDKNLVARKPLLGFDPVEVDSNLIVIEEDTVHFSSAHSARLQSVELLHGAPREVYPPLGDRLRKRLIAENAAKMPSAAICARMNDPCLPEIFDEDIRALTTNGKGIFAFLALQSASHALAPEEEPVTVAEQMVLYVYQRAPGGWRYCEEEIPRGKESSLEGSLSSDFASVVDRCGPSLPVTEDLSTVSNQLFLNR